MQVIQVATHYFGDGNKHPPLRSKVCGSASHSRDETLKARKTPDTLFGISYKGKHPFNLRHCTLSAPCSWVDVFSASNRAKPTDEAPHLTAAMQYYVNQSVVVGTMWAMTDRDGQDQAVPMSPSRMCGSGNSSVITCPVTCTLKLTSSLLHTVGPMN
ncbi:hypothetical protein EDB92DRAFT_1499193 [Lactarius akahatsu]|uniref:Uncharacterized protein n=1 Tax=Lactarius akahatsu TaxID=416441 RepID=A0AAD4LAX3_9AGAM|nr:hypothetical protein EDB92DRAFT_1499193 [Lactarius akahatsu]